MNHSFSIFTLKQFVPIQLQDSSPVLYKVNRKTESPPNTCDSAKLYLGVTFSLALPLLTPSFQHFSVNMAKRQFEIFT